MPDTRIAHVSALPRDDASGPIGGVGAYTASLLDILAGGRYEHVLVANRDAGASEIAALPADVRVIPTWCFGALRTPWRIFRELDAIAPDIVHLQHELFLYGPGVKALFFPLLLDRLRRHHRVVVTVHGVTTAHDIDESLLAGRKSPLPLGAVRPVIVAIFRAIARSGAELVVHSSVLRERLIELGASPGRVHTIAHPLFTARATANPPVRRAQARAALGIAPDAQVVLTWGYWNGYKGLDVLAAGFERFAAKRPRARLLLGTGPHPQLRGDAGYMTAYRSAATALAGPGREHIGFIDDDKLPTFIAAADVCVFAYTKHLAASGPATFALTSGSPVLFSSVFPDVAAALTFEPEPTALADALTRFFDDPAAHAAASAALRDHAGDDRILEAYQRLYSAMLARTSS